MLLSLAPSLNPFGSFIPSCLQLITTQLLSIIILDETLNMAQYGCMAVIMSGFFLVVWARRKEEKAKEVNVQMEGQLLEDEDDGTPVFSAFVLETVGNDDQRQIA